jgi:hypothetical protein
MTTNHHRLLVCSAWTSLSLAFALAGCSDFEIANLPPVAKAQVLVNGAAMTTAEPIPFMGTPIAITLDGTTSADKDGSVVKYLWLQTDVPNYVRYGLVDAGAAPPPPFAGDPPAVPAPQLMLGEGTYQYSLWVTDDGNLTSDPATVEFTIETPTTYMPNAACVTGYMAATPECSDCVCTPAAMTGCLETYQVCFENTDPMFATLCKAVVACAQRVGCVGSACYTGGCMAEITAAGTYMGGSLAEACALPDAAANPCAAASQLGACSSTGTCMAACN